MCVRGAHVCLCVCVCRFQAESARLAAEAFTKYGSRVTLTTGVVRKVEPKACASAGKCGASAAKAHCASGAWFRCPAVWGLVAVGVAIGFGSSLLKK